MNRVLALTLLVFADLAAKALATATLDSNEQVDANAWIQFVLRYNESGMGSWASAIEPSPAAADIVQPAFGLLGLAISVVACHRVSWSRLCKFACYLGAFTVGCVLGFATWPLFRGLSDPVLIGFGQLMGTVFFTSIWWVAPERRWRATFILFAATGYGNILCRLVPPHSVVDFIYSRPVSALFRHGVFNIADLYYDAAIVCLVVFALRAIFTRLRFRKRGAR